MTSSQYDEHLQWLQRALVDGKIDLATYETLKADLESRPTPASAENDGDSHSNAQADIAVQVVGLVMSTVKQIERLRIPETIVECIL